jgi:[acyl-carrier-protein] S-malonyltransferase
MQYETYAEQDLDGIPRFHNWYMALPGKSPYDPTYIEECKIRADAFFKEKEERKKLEEAAAAMKAAAAVSAAKPWSETPDAERDVAALFPGQGTQKVGMAAKLLENKTAHSMFDIAGKVLGYSLIDLCAQGPQEKLDTTLYSQPAIFVCSLAAMEIAKKDAPEMLKKIKTAAGFSLGEYSALVFGGALSFEDGLKVVKARAEAMDGAAKAAKSGMASIGGLADEKLQKALDDACAEVGKGKAYIANYMFPEGRTCSGDLKVLEKACELCTKLGAKNAKMLNVSGAFHTPYMEAAAAALNKALDEANIQMPSIRVYSNVTGKPYSSVEEIKSLLKRQLLEPVRWEQGTKDLIASSHSQYVEPGPGKQLKAMMRRIDQDAWNKTITLEK